MTKRWILPLAVVLAACGGSTDPGASGAAGATPTSSYVDATPDVAGLALETSGGASDGLALRADAERGDEAAAATCQPWQYLCRLRQGVRFMNAYVRAVVEPVEALAKTTPTRTGDDFRVFGPIDAPASAPVATFVLTVKKDSDADTFRWKLEAKKLGADDATYAVVLAGRLKKGEQAHRGAGSLAIDLDRLAALNPAPPAAPVFKGAGQIVASFKHLGQAKSLAYVVKGFVPDTTVTPAPAPVDAAFVGHKTPSGEAAVRLAAVDELVAPKGGGSDAGPELLVERGRWLPSKGGRAAVVVTDYKAGTDVASWSTTSPAFTVDYFLGVSCWDAQENEGYHKLFACTKSASVASGQRCVDATPASWPSSSADACKPGTDVADESNPPGTPDPKATTPEPNAPATPDAPPASLASLTF